MRIARWPYLLALVCACPALAQDASPATAGAAVPRVAFGVALGTANVTGERAFSSATPVASQLSIGVRVADWSGVALVTMAAYEGVTLLFGGTEQLLLPCPETGCPRSAPELSGSSFVLMLRALLGTRAWVATGAGGGRFSVDNTWRFGGLGAAELGFRVARYVSVAVHVRAIPQEERTGESVLVVPATLGVRIHSR